MKIPENPYIAGNQVGGTNAFVGRNDVLRDELWLQKKLTKRTENW